jgi:D-alanyl-lipoteichoic acid acyltransferase DltB (MBOAT superfamily)
MIFSDLVLPLAISFYTFQQIAFLTHVYKKNITIFDGKTYFAYIMFFPQLIAGPIVDYKDVSKDLIRPIKLNSEQFITGLLIYAIGFFKKTIIADYFSNTADFFYNSMVHNSYSFIDSWVGTLSYTLQLYFDFSGYCDMAIGLGLMYGMCIPINFNSPYKSNSIQEFWRRWHITLGRFLNRHLYQPLGGNRQGFYNELKAGLTTFILGGIWHGAGFTFIFWGFLHGIYLIIFKLYDKYIGISLGKLGLIITFLAVHLSWIPFRADDLNTTYSIYQSMIIFNQITYEYSMLELTPLIIGLGIVLFLPNSSEICGYKLEQINYFILRSKPKLIVSSILITICVLKLLIIPHTTFIYYDF